MACPQTENGHTRIANELLDAVLLFPFSKRQLLVLLAVIRLTYGWQKKADDVTSTQLAERTGLADSHCRAAVRELAEMGVLVRRPGQFGQVLELNKDYQAWRVPDRNSPGRTKSVRGADQNGPAERTETVREPGPKRSTPNKTPKESGEYTPPPPRTDMHTNAESLDPLPPSLALSSSKRGGGVEEGGKELIFPAGLTAREREHAAHLVAQCDGQAQALLDELAGLMKANAIRVSPLSCLRGMVRRALAGTFEPEAGLRVAEARAKQAQAQAALTRALQPPPEATPAMTPEEAKRQWRDYCERHGIGREAVT